MQIEIVQKHKCKNVCAKKAVQKNLVQKNIEK